MASIAKMSCDEESISLAILFATKSMGYLELRPLQEQVVKHFVGGRDVFVSFPTGGGKSPCLYDFLRKKERSKSERQSLVSVVSPLIVLIALTA